MRLFIAVDFNSENGFFEDVQNKIDTRLLKAKFTKTYHLTLKFLGEVEQGKVEEIISKLEGIKFTPFSVTVNSLGVFSDSSCIKVIWVGLEKNQKMIELQQKVDDILSDMFDRDKRFHPHITLARVRFVEDKEGLKRNISDIKVKKNVFGINSIKLIKSILTNEGPVYEDLKEFKGIAL